MSLITDPETDSDIETSAEASGWKCFIELTEMACFGTADPPPTTADGFELETVSEATFEDMRQALSIGFGDENEDIQSMVSTVFANYASVQPPGVSAIVARSETQPVAAGILYEHDDVGVVGILGTVPTARRLGLGSSITYALTKLAFDAGCDFACLESSPEGVSVYRGIGYQDFGVHRVWLPPEPT